MSGTEPGWIRRHKWLTAFIVIAVLGWAGNAGADEAEPDRVRPEPAATAQTPQVDAAEDDDSAEAEPEEEPTTTETAQPAKQRNGSSGGRDRAKSTKPKPAPEPKPAPAPPAKTYLVTRVIDGDTIELGNGAGVRIVGIDTPEVGECGYDAATASMERLVLHRQVRLTVSDEDTDRYGRWLRYVDVGPVDAGFRQIRDGFAIARYDSRDGYGFHPREPAYIAADRGTRNFACAAPAPAPSTPAPAPAGGACAPGYSPCIPPYPPDVNCDEVNGPIRVTGTDPHGLDADGDGVACE